MAERQPEERIQQGMGMQRRGLLAGVATLVAVSLTRLGADTVRAANGNPVLLGGDAGGSGVAQSATAVTWIDATAAAAPAFRATNSFGGTPDALADGVQGYANSGSTAGIFGRNNSANGVGTWGEAPSGTGAFGDSSSGSGVAGQSSSGAGVAGQSSSGAGVYGTSSGYAGVYGTSSGGAVNVSGVRGLASAGVTNGVWGENTSTATAAVGVYGLATTAATSGPTVGVWGRSNSTTAGSSGVYGEAAAGGTYGVSGHATSGYGVFGTSANLHGIVGLSGTGAGASGVVAVGTAPGTVGFQGVAQGGATFAGFFFGDVSINKRVSDGMGGNLGVAGAKFAIVKGRDGKYRGMYAMESPECWFEDFGEGKLVNGKVSITLDPLFAQHVHTDDYHVFLTEHGENNSLHVASRDASGFAVAADAGTLKAKGKDAAAVNGTFSYRVVARRNDIKGERLPVWEVPPGVDGTFAPVAVPSKPAAGPPPVGPPAAAPPSRPASPVAAPPSRPNPPAAVPPQGSGTTQGGTTSPVQPAPPPRP